MMMLVDYLTVFLVLKWILSELPDDLVLDQTNKLLLDAFVDYEVIRCNTGLTRVQELAEYDSSCSKLQICCLIHNAWTLSTKLKGYRYQILACFPKHDLADLLASCKEDIVEWKLQQLLILLPTTCNE